MKHAHILLLLPCGMLPPLAGAQRTEPPGPVSYTHLTLPTNSLV